MTATFSEAVTGFALADITVGNGAASNLATADNTTFTFDVTPTADGQVTVDVAAAVAQDSAGNDNTAAIQFTIDYATSVPSTISFEFPDYYLNHAGQITVTDDSANTDAATIQTISADVSCLDCVTASGTISVNLVETGVDSGVFVSASSVRFSSGSTDDSKDILYSEIGATVRASYVGSSTVTADTLILNPDEASIPTEGTPTLTTTSATGCVDSEDDGICDIWEKSTGFLFYPNDVVDDTNLLFGGLTALTSSYQINCVDFVGVDSNGNGILDGTESTKCPSPSHKDIFVELDYMTGHLLSEQAMQDVIDAFADQGIYLHILVSDELSHVDTINADIDQASPSQTQFDSIKLNNLADATIRGDSAALDRYKQFVHYGLSAHNIEWGGITTSSGFAEVKGNDFVVALGSYSRGVGSVDEQQGTLMHELGHNLNLRHGGPNEIAGSSVTGAAINCKPNQLSVMNYLYQFGPFDNTIPNNIPLEYSFYDNSKSAQLSESSLPSTYTAPAGSGYSVINFGKDTIMTSSPADGTTTIPWSGDPNYIPGIGCDDNTAGQTHDSFDEWNNVVFDVRSVDLWSDGIHMNPEFYQETFTSEGLAEIHAQQADSINDIIQGLPDESFAQNPDKTKSDIDNLFAQLASLTSFATASECADAQTLIDQIELLITSGIADETIKAELLADLDGISAIYENACDVGNTPDASESLASSISDMIQGLINDGTINKGQANSLTSKLDSALSSMDKGNDNAACGQLGSLENEINAMVSGNRLDVDDANSMLSVIAHLRVDTC